MSSLFFFSSFFLLSLELLSLLLSGNKEINNENNSVKNEALDFAVFILFVLLLDIDILLFSVDITSLNSWWIISTTISKKLSDNNLSVSFLDTLNIICIVFNIFLTISAVIFLLFSIKYFFKISQKLSMKQYLVISFSKSGLLLK